MPRNPYIGFQAQAAAFLFISGGKSVETALTIFQVLLLVSLPMTAASIGIRIYKKEPIWLFRVSNGFITPHYVFCALVFSVFFIIREFLWTVDELNTLTVRLCTVELFCIQSMRKFLNIDNRDRRDAVIFRSTRFLPLWFGGWMLAWATTLAPVLNRPPKGRYDLARHPILVNTVFCFVPALFISLAFVLIVIADHHWKDCLITFVLSNLELIYLGPELKFVDTPSSRHRWTWP